MTNSNLYNELRAHISDVHALLSDRTSTSLKVACEKISAVVRFCHPLRQTDWDVNNADDMYFYIKAFDTIKLGYEFCKYCSGETTPVLINLVYQLQSFFVTDITQRNLLRSVVLDPVSISQLAITLFDLGNIADRLDPRFSLPLWKLASSVIQFYKNELKHAASTEYLLILDKFLELLLSSVSFFYADCLQQLKSEDNKVASKDCPSLSSSLSVNLKMINLLCRIATFCIREFTVTSAPLTCTALSDWLVWLINTRYAGGLFTSGTGVPVLLVPHLEPSVFLCIDVTLDHLTTLPVASKENLACSWAAVCFRHADIDPVVKLRIYSGILVSLARHPHCYRRWLCDDFNVYTDTFTTCMQLDVSVSGEDMRTSEYVAACRSNNSPVFLCPVNQYSPFLLAVQEVREPTVDKGYHLALVRSEESALLRGLLCNHSWTSMLAADVWCFVARYGTGSLCWQYVTLFATAIELAIVSLASTTERSPLLYQLDKLGGLLARFLVFLTPKQQFQFLQKFPLNRLTLSCSSESKADESPLFLWRFVPLMVDRLQKSARVLAEDQLSERMTNLLHALPQNPSDIHMAIETSLAQASAICSQVTMVSSPMLSFVALRAWHGWLSSVESSAVQTSSLKFRWQRTLSVLLKALHPTDMLPLCATLLDSIKQKLSTFEKENPTDRQCSSSGSELSSCLQEVSRAFTSLETQYPATSFSWTPSDSNALRDLSIRIARFVQHLQISNPC
ncbi:hypothetical protein P879_05891 [Paragonimus westermani]|uniref:Uncharacterized protein n=1 Tax=Paragonimus westermani TaxID=34504 RepID=A0A8T0D6B4_9TREM|nr:hypothetical protein P879_05891 [Paragonimus westermani]